MDVPAPGDTYDCDFCGETHEVRSGKGVAVKGFEPRVDEAVYARCPAVGVVDLRADEPTPVGESAGGDDWP